MKILKIREIFCENPRIIFVLFYDVHKEDMFTINLEDGREAPSKASIFIFFYNYKLNTNYKSNAETVHELSGLGTHLWEEYYTLGQC